MWDHFKKFKKPIQPIQPIQETKTKRIKILTSIKMPERLPIALVQTKAGHASDNLSEIKNIVYLLYQANEITKKHITIRLNP